MVAGYEAIYQQVLASDDGRAGFLADEEPHTSRRWSRLGRGVQSTRAALVNTQRGAIRIGRVSLAGRYGRWRCRVNRIPLNLELGVLVACQHRRARLAMHVRPTGPGPIVPGSDFAGGALPLTAEAERGQPNEERAA